MMDMGEIVRGIRDAIPEEAARAGVDSGAVSDAMMADLMQERQDEQLAVVRQVRNGSRMEYHDAAKRGIMRTTGVSSDEYDWIRENNPFEMKRLRSEYMDTI